eukprot:scaffold184_cov316-Pinguiococcus_pyrenoidosus.AAC.15
MYTYTHSSNHQHRHSFLSPAFEKRTTWQNRGWVGAFVARAANGKPTVQKELVLPTSARGHGQVVRRLRRQEAQRRGRACQGAGLQHGVFVVDADGGAEPVLGEAIGRVRADKGPRGGADAQRQVGVLHEVLLRGRRHRRHAQVGVEAAPQAEAGEEGPAAAQGGQAHHGVEGQVCPLQRVDDGLPAEARAEGRAAEEEAHLRLLGHADGLVHQHLLAQEVHGVPKKHTGHVSRARDGKEAQLLRAVAGVLRQDRGQLPAKARGEQLAHRGLCRDGEPAQQRRRLIHRHDGGLDPSGRLRAVTRKFRVGPRPLPGTGRDCCCAAPERDGEPGEPACRMSRQWDSALRGNGRPLAAHGGGWEVAVAPSDTLRLWKLEAPARLVSWSSKGPDLRGFAKSNSVFADVASSQIEEIG